MFCMGMVLQRRTLADDPLTRQVTDAIAVELALTPHPHFVIRGLDADDLDFAKKQIKLSVHSSSTEATPPVIGRFEIAGEQLQFHPRFPLSRSVEYNLQLPERLLDTKSDPAQLIFSLPKLEQAEATRVEAIYPSDDYLPENLLKFYIYFSRPMSRGEAYQRIRLFQGESQIDEPFLELGEELWNAEQTRFTLFIHPGRIKRGVQPRELKGPSLSAGKDFTLRIDGAWQDANGAPLTAEAEKKFTVTAPIHDQLDPLHWKIDTPPVKSREPVKLTFDRSLDQAMLGRVLEVKYNDGSIIAGTIELKAEETEWWFTPNDPWKIGAYNIEILTNLEDICGNSIAAPFEVKMELGATETPQAKVAIAFIVK